VTLEWATFSAIHFFVASSGRRRNSRTLECSLVSEAFAANSLAIGSICV
jgi:hypothetical protein